VKDGPVKEVLWKGNDVRVKSLPAHIQGHKDAAPFISSGLSIVKDPDTGIRNMSFHRIQVKEDNKTGIMMVPGRHTHLIHRKYEAMNKPMRLPL